MPYITLTDGVLGMFAKFRKMIPRFVMSVGPYAQNNSVPTGRIFLKSDVEFFGKTVEKFQVSFISDKNNGYFT